VERASREREQLGFRLRHAVLVRQHETVDEVCKPGSLVPHPDVPSRVRDDADGETGPVDRLEGGPGVRVWDHRAGARLELPVEGLGKTRTEPVERLVTAEVVATMTVG
jgi:hypothetical protein